MVIEEQIGMIEKSDTIAAVLGGFLIVQIIAEQVIFRYLSKKYWSIVFPYNSAMVKRSKFRFG